MDNVVSLDEYRTEEERSNALERNLQINLQDKAINYILNNFSKDRINLLCYMDKIRKLKNQYQGRSLSLNKKQWINFISKGNKKKYTGEEAYRAIDKLEKEGFDKSFKIEKKGCFIESRLLNFARTSPTENFIKDYSEISISFIHPLWQWDSFFIQLIEEYNLKP